MLIETQIEYDEFLRTVSPSALKAAEWALIVLMVASAFLLAVPIMFDLHRERVVGVSPRGVIVDLQVLPAFPKNVKVK